MMLSAAWNCWHEGFLESKIKAPISCHEPQPTFCQCIVSAAIGLKLPGLVGFSAAEFLVIGSSWSDRLGPADVKKVEQSRNQSGALLKDDISNSVIW